MNIAIEVDKEQGRPQSIFMTAATCDRPGSGVGVVYFALSGHFGTVLRAIDYRLAELRSVHDAEWLLGIYEHAGKLRDAYRPYESAETGLHAEGLLHQALLRTFSSDSRIMNYAESGGCDLYEIDREDILAMTFDQRMAAAQMQMAGGRLLKIRGMARRPSMFRNISANHLLNQVASVLPGRKEPQELAAALALGALLVLTQ